MSKKEKQNPIGRFFGSPLFLIIGIPLAFILIFTFVRSYYNNYKVNQEIAFLEKEIQNLATRKFELMGVLNFAMSDQFVEEKARTELNMKKEGENVLVFKNDTQYPKEKNSDSGPAGQKISNALRWWYYFTNQRSKIESQN